MFNIDISNINTFIGKFFNEISKILDLTLDFFTKLIYYVVLFGSNSFATFITIEICILMYTILKSKQHGAEYSGQGGFNKIIFMFEKYIKIHYTILTASYLFFNSLYKTIFKTATLIIDGIRLFKPFG